MRRKLPIPVTLLLCLVLYITGWQVIRFSTSIAWRETLKTYELYPGPIYIGISGAFWALTGLFLLWSMWRGKRWIRTAFILASSLYAAWVWADRLFVQAQMRANWPFDLLLTIVMFVFTMIVLLDPRNKIYFERETYERES
jgi:hypothetical protein